MESGSKMATSSIREHHSGDSQSKVDIAAASPLSRRRIRNGNDLVTHISSVEGNFRWL